MTQAEILADKYKKLLDKNGINTRLRLSHFFAQCATECKLVPKKENLNYSVEGLLSNFGRHRISEQDAKKFGRTDKQPANQKEIANKIYGGDWGRINLGNIETNDGSKYIGRGYLQITGRSNYSQLTKDTGVDFTNNPDLLLNEEYAMIAAVWYFNNKKLYVYADKDDYLSVSRIVNIGRADTQAIPKAIEERKMYTEKYKNIFK